MDFKRNFNERLFDFFAFVVRVIEKAYSWNVIVVVELVAFGAYMLGSYMTLICWRNQ